MTPTAVTSWMQTLQDDRASGSGSACSLGVLMFRLTGLLRSTSQAPQQPGEPPQQHGFDEQRQQRSDDRRRLVGVRLIAEPSRHHLQGQFFRRTPLWFDPGMARTHRVHEIHKERQLEEVLDHVDPDQNLCFFQNLERRADGPTLISAELQLKAVRLTATPPTAAVRQAHATPTARTALSVTDMPPSDAVIRMHRHSWGGTQEVMSAVSVLVSQSIAVPEPAGPRSPWRNRGWTGNTVLARFPRLRPRGTPWCGATGGSRK